MGIFINNGGHPDIYKNTKHISEPNQGIVRQNTLLDLIHEQQQTNAALMHSLTELKTRYEQLEQSQAVHWNNMQHRMTDLSTSSKQTNDHMLQKLQTMDERNQHLQTVLE